uniref:G_PROTEIN_RECEP_F1_2 domain-containing protein n=1 Tax=Strongyloides venezuelensis TaxID=75913 RepID=A0A0K0F0R5_STRVS
MNPFDIFQLVYEIPSYFCYVMFTVQLGFRLIRKEKTFSNSFYILMFYKGVNDITLQTTIFLLIKVTIFSSSHDFFRMNSYLCFIFNLITIPCYAVTFQVMLIMSINRYIAVGQPIMYERLFQNYIVCIYISITLVIGGLIGFISLNFDCSYAYSSILKRMYISFDKSDIISFVLAYTFGLYIPLIAISFILNIITIKKLKIKNFISSMGSSPDMRLLVYSLFGFVIGIVFLSVYILRIVGIFTSIKLFNVVGTASLSYIIDIETYGSFYFSLYTK